MKLYVSHSTGFDYKTELYAPLKHAFANKYEVFYPHDTVAVHNSKVMIEECDAVLAEVSYPSTGQGIELGWANASGVPIICFYKVGESHSSAVKIISGDIYEYSSAEEMIEKLNSRLLTI